MTRKTIAALALTLPLAGAVTVPALTGAQAPGPRDITVRMKVTSGAEVKHGKGAKLATGDSLLIRLAMSGTDGANLGTAYTDCTNVGPKAAPEKAMLQCTQTYRFKDGQIVIAGVVSFSNLDGLAISIVGGSGAYRGAKGHMTSGAPIKGFDSVDVLSLD